MENGQDVKICNVSLTVEVKADSLESLDEFLEMAEAASKGHPGIPIHVVVKVG